MESFGAASLLSTSHSDLSLGNPARLSASVKLQLWNQGEDNLPEWDSEMGLLVSHLNEELTLPSGYQSPRYALVS